MSCIILNIHSSITKRTTSDLQEQQQNCKLSRNKMKICFRQSNKTWASVFYIKFRFHLVKTLVFSSRTWDELMTFLFMLLLPKRMEMNFPFRYKNKSIHKCSLFCVRYERGKKLEWRSFRCAIAFVEECSDMSMQRWYFELRWIF